MGIDTFPKFFVVAWQASSATLSAFVCFARVVEEEQQEQ